MPINPTPQIAPLVEDLRRIITDKFLTSTCFKRWIVQNNIADEWDSYLDYANRTSNIFVPGYQGELDAHDALVLFLNHAFSQNPKLIGNFIVSLLDLYHCEKNKTFDVDDICKDLQIIGIESDVIQNLRDICSEQKNELAEDTPRDTTSTYEHVRQLEESYCKYDGDSCNSREAISAYHEWHKVAVLFLSQFHSEENADYTELKNLDNSGNGYSLRHNYDYIQTRYNLLMENAQKPNQRTTKAKKPLVFISHSSEDKEFAEALVILLEDMGLNEETIFCSSVDGYGLSLNENIFDGLRKRFDSHDLFVIFIHSPRYYKSAISLNEMGAAWVLRTEHCSLLTCDMEFNGMKGIVNETNICIKVNASDVHARLNELYETIQSFFGLQPLTQTKWERKRNAFIEKVNK